MNLVDAIAAYQDASSKLVVADQNQLAAQSAFDAAKTAKETADKADAAAVMAFNASLDAVVLAAQAAKR